MRPTVSTGSGRIGRAAALVATAALVAGVVLMSPAGSASASSVTAHDPIGSAQIAAARGGLVMTGWAADPDALRSNATVAAIVDGRILAATVPTSKPDAAVTSRYGTGPTPGFALTVPVATGTHTACLIVRNVGAGLDAVLKCVVVPLGTTPTAAQVAAHSPTGVLTAA